MFTTSYSFILSVLQKILYLYDSTPRRDFLFLAKNFRIFFVFASFFPFLLFHLSHNKKEDGIFRPLICRFIGTD